MPPPSPLSFPILHSSSFALLFLIPDVLILLTRPDPLPLPPLSFPSFISPPSFSFLRSPSCPSSCSLQEEGACDVEALVTEILSRWSAESATVKQEEEKAAELRAEQVAAASKQAAADAATFKAPEKTKCLLNAASKDILTAQLSHIIVEDDEGSEGSDDGKEDQWSTSTKPLSQKKERKARKQQDAATAAAFFENTNRSSVQAAAAQARQVSKAQAQAKKAKDKADLSADRDRKEKKKEERRKAAQKGERRR
eukprot:m.267665 g.267665  ORF g.267665 m.267665 type:complete len:253 (+) comp19287_c2_seq3:498-1256(+)